MTTLKKVKHIPEEGEKRLLTWGQVQSIKYVVAIGNHVKPDVIEAFADTIDALVKELRRFDDEKAKELLERIEYK